MKIHSKFRDYYDSVQKHGQDETVHFIRNIEQLEIPTALKNSVIKNVDSEYLHVKHVDNRTYTFLSPFVILFCGKLYRGLRYVSSNYNTKEYIDLGKIFYNKEQALEFFYENQDFKDTFYFEKRKKSIATNISKWLEKQSSNELEEYAIENKIAIAYIGKQTFKNPCLQDLEFYRIIDSYTAYQELDMYISGVLTKDSTMMVEISDKDRIPQHGFDKWSFRKLPTKSR